jgi:hypothetical protein
MMLLVMGGVDVNPGPLADQLMLDLILEHVKNQGHETEPIREMMKAHSQEIADTRKGIDDLGPKFNLLNEAVSSVINYYNQIKMAVRKWEERQEVLDRKVRFLEDGYKKKNIIIFGLEEKGGEGFLIPRSCSGAREGYHENEYICFGHDNTFRLGKKRW